MVAQIHFALATALLAHLATAISIASTVTPVEKVITLLENVQETVGNDGKREAAEYDKFACFCKDEASNHQYSVEQSQKKITSLNAAFETHDKEAKDLAEQIGTKGSSDPPTHPTPATGLTKKIEELENVKIPATQKDIADLQTAHADNKKMLEYGIKRISEAIEAFKAAKGGLQGHVKKDGKLAAIHTELKAASDPELRAVAALIQSKADPKDPAGFTFQSNDIIATLQGLKTKFSAKLADDTAEYQRELHALQSKELQEQNQKTFAEQEKAELIARMTKAEQAAQQADTDRIAEDDAMTKDKAYLSDLAEQCETQADTWNQRSKSRADELKALSDAIGILKAEVDPKYAANKKLVGLQRRQLVHKKAGAVSLLQLRGSGSAQQLHAVQGVLAHLQQSAKTLHSPMLSALVAKAVLQTDHFVKVRGLIKDLIQKLKDQATAEATRKSWCDKEMSEQIAARDTKQTLIEEKTSALSTGEADKAQLQTEIAEHAAKIAEIQKALAESKELRSSEKAANTITLTDCGAAIESVGMATEVLSNYYQPSLVQVSQGQAPNVNREGKTVSDGAPALSYSGDYSGKQEESKGILGLLAVIKADFERTCKVTGENENTLQTNHEAETLKREASLTAEEGLKGTKEDGVIAKDVEIGELQKALKEAEQALSNAKAQLETLKVDCVDGEETWEQRKEAREHEIEALKSALEELENWKN